MNWSLVADGPMLKRWAEHLTKGAKKYDSRNWLKANTEEEQQRFAESAFRHFMQWYGGERDEDHAAAAYFNINGYEYVDLALQRGKSVEAFFTYQIPPKFGNTPWDGRTGGTIYAADC